MVEAPALQCVRDRHPAWFRPAINTKRLFMWQREIVGVAHSIMQYSDVLAL